MPSRNEGRLRLILDRTAGRCHICWGSLAFSNYGLIGERGAWEVEHSNPRSKGGSERLNNLYAAHISCNREKGASHTRTARARNGQTRAPLSKTELEERRIENTWGLAGVGAISGAALAGPVGFLLGAVAGALIGRDLDPG
jgi:hypothetical protein